MRRLPPDLARVTSRLSLVALLLLGGCAYFRITESTLEQAQAAQAAGDEVKAEELYREAMREKGRDREDAKRGLVSLLLQKAVRVAETDQEEAMRIHRDVLTMVPESDEARIAYGRALMNSQRFTEAIDVLMEAPKCRGCKTMISVIYIARAEHSVSEGAFTDALADYDQAIALSHDPLTVLAKVDIYTKSGHGKADDAVAWLDQAQRLLPVDQTGQQALWFEKRTEVIYWAAMRSEHEAIGRALTLDDPRTRVPAEQKLIDQLNLQMYAASLQIYQQQFDVGTQRGLATWQQAQAANLSGAPLESLRKTLLSLFAQRVAVHMANGEEKQAREVIAMGRQVDPEDRMLALQDIIVTAMRNTGNARKMLEEWKDDEAYVRMRALVETVYAQKMMGIGQFTAAAGAVEKAKKIDPNLLETKLAAAELLAETRLVDLRKVWAENFREIATYSYPGGRINYYGQALAELRGVQAMFDENAQRDFLRGPSVGKRIAALEQRITGFYPFAVESRPDGKATIVLTRKEGSAVTVAVQGPSKAHEVAVPENGQAELVLEGPGYVVVTTPSGGRKAMFAEPGVAIIVDL
ncbi:tetratricopeptide repeat protein [Nannocystaceae bacterium ST9]